MLRSLGLFVPNYSIILVSSKLEIVSVGSLTGVLGPVGLGVTTSSTCSGSSAGSDLGLDAESVSEPLSTSALGSRPVMSEAFSDFYSVSITG